MRKKWSLPAIFLGGVLLLLISSLRPPEPANGIHLGGFGALPVLDGGRVKPLDSIARQSLLFIHGKQTLRFDGETLDAMTWLMRVMSEPKTADTYPAFVIYHELLHEMMGLPAKSKHKMSFASLSPYLERLSTLAQRYEKIEKSRRDAYQRAVILLNTQAQIYVQLKNSLRPENRAMFSQDVTMYRALLTEQPDKAALLSENPHEAVQSSDTVVQTLSRYVLFLAQWDQLSAFRAIPSGDTYQTAASVMASRLKEGASLDTVLAYQQALEAYQISNGELFYEQLAQLLKSADQRDLKMACFESFFNHLDLFYKVTVIYVGVILVTLISWLVGQGGFWSRFGYGLLSFGVILHSLGLIFRMLIQARPPVTNLYSSAVFVGWVAAVLAVIMERKYRNGLGQLVAGVVGFLTLIIAHHLSIQGDTLEMMQAVLDTNFWLSTHVVTIVMGYGAAFMAGFLGIGYVCRLVFDSKFTASKAKPMVSMAFGMICFALLLSTVGTILGGIWADQSWGRFWGWDPKENGALLLVLWLAIILHARIAGLVGPRGVMVLAVGNNIVTAFSWFGVNMLGIGLHSYGFMDAAFFWLLLFSLANGFVMYMGSLPKRFFRSNL